MNTLSEVHLPSRVVRQWRSLIQYRQKLVACRTAVKNRIRAILDREGLTMPGGRSGWTRRHLAELATLSRPMIECGFDELWRGELAEELAHLKESETRLKRVEATLDRLAQSDTRVARLRTIPGVGARLAETIVAVIDDPHRFKSGKEVASYVGLTPRQFQSGNSDRHGGISGRGHKDLRKLLVEVSWLGLHHNERMRMIYERLCRGVRTRKKIAIVAVARRLLIWCWAMLRDETDWKTASASAIRLTAA
jgi:transposase